MTITTITITTITITATTTTTTTTATIHLEVPTQEAVIPTSTYKMQVDKVSLEAVTATRVVVQTSGIVQK